MTDKATISTPPAQYPADTAHGAGWRYKLAGAVNLETGAIHVPGA